MIAPRPSIRRTLLLGAVVLVATLPVRVAALPPALSLPLPALAACLAGWSLLRRGEAAHDTALQETRRRLAEAEAGLAANAKAAAQLRHDLRGILSPALLTADRLSNSQDPVARRAAETMISTVERAELRLRDG